MYMPDTKAIFSIEKPLSIIKPNTAVPKAVENTIKAVVKAFIDPINFKRSRVALQIVKL